VLAGSQRAPFRSRRVFLAIITLLLASSPLQAQRPAWLPQGARVERNVAYGPSSAQRLDVYRPARASDAPVIIMVHGGGWTRGDKTSHGVVQHKVEHWLPKGYIVVSVNYRMVPAVNVRTEAEDVARAVSYIQQNAARWGGNGEHVVLMGHSAGGHLVALVAADSALARRDGVRPWLATIGLDAGAYDVTTIMQVRHLALYDRAFGSDSAFWRRVSPTLQLDHATAPLLLVCSSRRRDSCAQATAFAARARETGGEASVLPLDKSHAQIDSQLGADSAYTSAVDIFLARAGLH
jgi:acetyl esterase/lipase